MRAKHSLPPGYYEPTQENARKTLGEGGGGEGGIRRG